MLRTVDLQCPLYDSDRVRDVARMFDVPLAGRLREQFAVDVPPLDFDWQIGAIVGPSGSGKTGLARVLFPGQCDKRISWPTDRAVVDCFGEASIREISELLTAVGFSSPPSWVKPYTVLSGGEKFRCDLARALAPVEKSQSPKVQKTASSASDSSTLRPFDSSTLPPVVFDEFTSVVDRNVARIGSAAVAKAIRTGKIRRQFVAVTCHYDIFEWLEPDWTIDMATREFQRRSLRRPKIRLRLHRAQHVAWRLFARHHYLSGKLNPAARCFVAVWRQEQERTAEGAEDKTQKAESRRQKARHRRRQVPVAFCATLPIIGKRKHWRISRIVTLPDFQGVGIGSRVMEAVADWHCAQGQRLNITAAHPAVVSHCRRSPKWRLVKVRKSGSRPFTRAAANYRGSTGRAVVSFEYVSGYRSNDADHHQIRQRRERYHKQHAND